MAKTKNQRKRQKERQKVSANRWLEEDKPGYQPTTFNTPEGMERFKPDKPGARRLEIIPFTAGAGNPFADEGFQHFERTFWVHQSIGANENPYCCLAKTFDKKCPVCEYRATLAKGDEDDVKLAEALVPKKRQLWLVYDHKDPDKGAQLWEQSYHWFGRSLQDKLKEADEDEREAWADFADPEDGKTLRVTFIQDSFGGRSFIKPADVEFHPRKKDLDPELLDDVPCLDELLIEKSYEELKAILLQSNDEEEDDDEDDEDEKPSKKKKGKKDDKKSKKKKPEPEEEDDEDEDEDTDDDDEDEEEEKPSKSKSKGKGKKKSEPEEDEDDDDWDDDEDEDEDDDEEEEKPAKKSKSKSKPKSSKKSKKDDDEDEDDDDWDDDDD